jgi:tetratricopeptide (TPR) repeat protein
MGRFLRIFVFVSLIAGYSSTTEVSSAFAGTGLFKFSSENDTSKVNSYIRDALALVSKPKMVEKIKEKIDTAELICQREHIEFPSLLYLARAEYFFLSNDFKSASEDANIALRMSKNSGETEVLAKTLSFLGRYNLRTGFYKESIEYFKKSIAIARDNGLKGIIPESYNRLKAVYEVLGDQKEYRNTLKILIDAAMEEQDTMYLETGYYFLGSSMTEEVRDFKKADSLLRRCLEIALVRMDTDFIALPLANLGWNYYREKQYAQALESYNKSLRYSLPGKRYAFAANSYGNIGTIYRDMGDQDKSLNNYLKAIEQAKKVEDVYNLSWVYQDMSEMYLRKKDTANAYKTFVLFKKYSDIQLSKNNIKGLSDARIGYEAGTRNKEVELLSLKLNNQRLLIYGSTGFFILTIAIGILLLSRSKINSKRRISEMNRKIAEMTQANLRQQMNPHFIFNTLNSIQYYMYQHDKLATNNYLTKFSSLMRKVLENSQHTHVPIRDELDALNLYLELELIRFKDKFEYMITVDEEIDTLLYKIPTMLIQPFVENSISHGVMPCEYKGLIKIDLKLEDEYLTCVIEDNGIGREAAQEKKRRSESNHNSLGTQIVSSRLDLVNSLYGTSLKTIYTDLKNSKGEPEGTRVEIQIPIIT